MIQVPIFHVNGDHPEAVIHATKLAMAYRQRFGDDVVIDLVCYRRHGHNEGDEPAFTQPRLYRKIREKKSVETLYLEKLVAGGRVSREEAERIEKQRHDALQEALQVIHSRPPGPDEPYEPRGPWAGYSRVRPGEKVETAVSVERLAMIAEGTARVPSYFNVHKKLQAILDARAKCVSEGMGDRLGSRRGARLRVAVARGHARPAVGSGLLARHLRPSTRRAGRPGLAARNTPRSITSARTRRISRSTTACSPKRPCSASSTATAWPIRARWSSGRRSSATS